MDCLSLDVPHTQHQQQIADRTNHELPCSGANAHDKLNGNEEAKMATLKPLSPRLSRYARGIRDISGEYIADCW